MNVLVTGANGFIGRSLLGAYAARGYKTIGLVRRTRNRESLRQPGILEVDYFDSQRLKSLIKEFAPCWVIHAAGDANPQKSIDSPLECFMSNALLTEQMLNAIRGTRTRFCLISSSSVYGATTHESIEESASKNPVTPYGNSKLIAEQTADLYDRLYHNEALILRVFSVYGPGLRKQVVYDTMSKVFAESTNGRLLLQSSGCETRDFIYIVDLVEAVVFLTGVKARGTLNVASGIGVRIIDLVRQIIELGGSSMQIVPAEDTRPSVNWTADVSRLSDLGFRPRVSLADGLKYTVDWFKDDRSGKLI